ncbi:UdgX family uracil-DNA binding protein [Profundibacterium mesophilum]|uniref:Type-4 uracil-DNA glycosylase n=1 Tax=Profundibacterium mesophilum KAUST100406-0324 TaxID=1037889 RepID=A0A921NRK1_9RHOB|nr:UdgX family uracil-DNA binding protein [Profundibacterium mesophilum]KAF0677377.1 uracil-DNA glycosylase [Profundibacterium mesophilum KAUST100406-0324]
MLHVAHMPPIGTLAAWRDAARRGLTLGIEPQDMLWTFGAEPSGLFTGTPLPQEIPQAAMTVPRSFVELASNVVWHSDPERFAQLYALLHRLRRTAGLMEDRGDPALARLRAAEKQVTRDKHKMKAFVRFREIERKTPGRRRFGAWFEPDHHIAEPLAPFFARRFGDMDWIIATPQACISFESGRVDIAPGSARPDHPDDATEALWTTYFRNIFNPARLKIKAMQAEMPKKYWKNMPETASIPDLIANAEQRARAMQDAAPTLPPLRSHRILDAAADARPPAEESSDQPDTLDALSRAEAACRRCPLHANATQVVPGSGPQDATMMIVGEQPGDREDLEGRPFVGPAGQLFDTVAAEAGLDRDRAFVTNAVKHFKFTPRGKRRIHARPDAGEVRACKWWLDAELRIVRPKLIVAMGATAAASLTGTGKGITKRQGAIEPGPQGIPVLLTVHPSYLLRIPEPAARAEATARFRGDLEQAVRTLATLSD